MIVTALLAGASAFGLGFGYLQGRYAQHCVNLFYAMKAERDEAQAVAERQQDRIRAINAWAAEAEQARLTCEEDVARLSAEACDREHLLDRQQRHMDAVLGENHRLRAADTPGAKLNACKLTCGGPSKVERDPVVREQRKMAA